VASTVVTSNLPLSFSLKKYMLGVNVNPKHVIFIYSFLPGPGHTRRSLRPGRYRDRQDRVRQDRGLPLANAGPHHGSAKAAQGGRTHWPDPGANQGIGAADLRGGEKVWTSL
jgi:hypothetical protein